ncbi:MULTISPECIES: hypothetical protein [unclassified Pseudofrankia]|uniref:hypothetical protein n=1 Tax=unclassified Pseudofrankia TaxID=2994372 RepID=UPI0026AAC67B
MCRRLCARRVNSLLALGFTDDDVAGDGSGRLVDALVARGSADQVWTRSSG